MFPSETRSTIPASAPSARYEQPFDDARCSAGDFIDQFEAIMNSQRNAREALPALQMNDDALPFVDDIVSPSQPPPPTMLAQPPAQRQRPEADIESWNRDPFWPVPNNSTTFAGGGQAAMQDGMTTKPSAVVGPGYGVADAPCAWSMNPHGSNACDQMLFGQGGRAGSKVAGDDFAVPFPAPQQQRPVGPLRNTKFDAFGYAATAETPAAYQRSFHNNVPVDAFGAAHQAHVPAPRHGLMNFNAANSGSASTWFGDWSNFAQEEPSTFNVNTDCMLRTLGARVHQDAGHDGFAFDAPAADSQRRTAARASQNFLATNGLGTEPNRLNSRHHAHAGSFDGAKHNATMMMTRPWDTQDLARGMSAYVIGEPSVAGHSGVNSARAPRARRRSSTEQEYPGYPSRHPRQEQPAQPAKGRLLADGMIFGTPTNAGASDGQGKQKGGAGDRRDAAPVEPTSSSSSAGAASSIPATRVADAHAEESSTNNRPRVKNKSVAKPSASKAKPSHTNPAQSSNEREQDGALAPTTVLDTELGQAGKEAKHATAPATQARTSSKPATLMENCSLVPHVRPRVSSLLLGALHLEDNGAGPTLDALGLPSFLHEYGKARTTTAATSSVEQRGIDGDARQSNSSGEGTVGPHDKPAGEQSLPSSGLPSFLCEQIEAQDATPSDASSPPLEGAVPMPHFD